MCVCVCVCVCVCLCFSKNRSLLKLLCYSLHNSFPKLICFSLFIRKFHCVHPSNGNFCEAGQAQFAEKDGNFISGCQQNVFYSIFYRFEAVFEPVQGSFTMNVQNEPLHGMTCVVKRGTPSNGRCKLCEFRDKKEIIFRGANSILLRGLAR